MSSRQITKCNRAAERQTRPQEVHFAGQRRRDRRGLLTTTALQASSVLLLALPSPLLAQPAVNARPTGGSVVAGQASIDQSNAQTTVNQSSQRAAIDWRSFDVGSGHTVTYQQPNSSSLTVNRVTGSDPSQIAGRIQANGQVAIVNGSGVMFTKGSQVDVQSLVVSTANISNGNVMAGKLVFDKPGRPDALVSNAGSITVKAAGLAALVAPQVQNSGTITATLGHVVLAGAQAHTVDLYGDGLMSVDVTKQVARAANGSTVLVTNSGVINADGGTIVLTAKAADGILTNLVSNTGRLRANTADGQTGMIMVSAIGGSISIDGVLQSEGRVAGTTGGAIMLNASNAVTVGSSARISVNGRDGGGTVAVGTSLARARAQGGGVPADAAQSVTIAAGAKIAADARGNGSGGAVALLSSGKTTVAGALSARGGRHGGNGGQIEISGTTVAISGTVDTRAPAGKTGLLTIDPDTLVIGADQTTANPAPPNPDGTNQSAAGAETISATTFNGFLSPVSLQATKSITLQGGTVLTSGYSVTLKATGAGAAINVNVGLTAAGGVSLASMGTGGAVAISAPISGQTVSLSGTTVAIGAAIASTGPVKLISINADFLNLTGGSISAPGGTVAVAPVMSGTAMTVETVKNTGAGLSLTQADLNILAAAGLNAPATLVLGDTASIPAAATATAGSISFATGTTVNAATLALYTTGSVTQTGTLAVGTLTGASTGATTLNSANAVTNLGPYTAGTGLVMTDSLSLTVLGPVLSGAAAVIAAPGLTLAADLTAKGEISFQIPGAVSQTSGTVATPGTITLSGSGGAGPAGKINQSGGIFAGAAGVTLLVSGDALQTGGEVAGSIISVSSGGTASFGVSRAPTVNFTPGTTSTPATVTVAAGGSQPLSFREDARTINVASVINAATVELHSENDTTQTAAITAETLTGTAGYARTGSNYDIPIAAGSATLTNPANAITNLAAYYAGGNLLIGSGGSLAITGKLVAGDGQRLAVTSGTAETNTLTVNPGVQIGTGTISGGVFAAIPGAGTFTAGGSGMSRIELNANVVAIAPTSVFSAPGGIIAIAPVTARPMLIDTVSTPGSLVLAPATLTQFTTQTATAPGTLVLGSTAVTPTAANATATAITFNQNTDLTTIAATLGLYTSGAVSQANLTYLHVGNEARIQPGTLTGEAGTSITLANTGTALAPLNSFDRLQDLSAVNGVQIGEIATPNEGQAGLMVLGTLANKGSGGVALTSIGTLLGASRVGGTITIGGTIDATGQTLTMTAQDGAAAANAMTEANGVILANTLTGRASTVDTTATLYDVLLASTGNRIVNLGPFIVGTGGPDPSLVSVQGKFTLMDSLGLTINGQVSAKSVAITANTLAVESGGDIGACIVDGLSGDVTLTATTGAITLANGTIGGQSSVVLNTVNGVALTGATVDAGLPTTPGTVTITGGLTETGGSLFADTVTVTGGITVNGGLLYANTLNPNVITYGNGDVYAGNGLSVTAAGAFLLGSLATPGDLVITGTGALTSTAMVAAGGKLSIAIDGDFVQTAGTLAGATAVDVTASGLITQSGGVILSGSGTTASGAILLLGQGSAGTAASLRGTLSAATIKAAEPGYSLTSAPLSLTGAASVAVGPLTLTPHCFGCDTNMASATYGLTATAGTDQTATARFDGSSLTLGTLSAGTLELHSAADTTNKGAGGGVGTITAGILRGTAGYSATGADTDNFPIYPVLATAGSLSLTAPATGTNTIAKLGPFYAGGNITVDAGGLMTVVDKVIAGPNQVITLQAPALTVDGMANAGLITFGAVTSGTFINAARPANAGTVNHMVNAAASTVDLVSDALTLTGTAAVIDARGGLVAIAPLTAKTALSVDPSHATAPWIVASELSLIDTLGTGVDTGGAQTIRLASLDGTAGVSSSLSVNGVINLVSNAATLGLYSAGNITETPSNGVTIGTAMVTGAIMGTSGGTVTLTGALAGTAPALITPSNHFDLLNGFTAATGLTVANATTGSAALGGLSIHGNLSSGSGPLSLLSVGATIGASQRGGTIAIGSGTTAATIDATGQILTLTARDGASNAPAITETATSSIVATTLTGRASTVDTTATAYAVALSGTGNQIDTLGQFIVGTGGPDSNLVSVQGAFGLLDASGLTVTGQVSAKSIALTATNMTVSGDVGACIVDGAGGDVSLTTTAGTITLVSGTVGGQSGVTLDASGGVALTGGTLDAGLLQAAGSVNITNGLTETSGSLFADTVSVAGGATIIGGLLHANTLNAGTIAFRNGDLYAGNDLAIAGGPGIGGAVATPGNLTVGFTGNAVIAANLLAQGNIAITGAGNITQSAGTIAAGGAVDLVAGYTNVGGFMPAAGGGIITQASGAVIEAGSTTLVRASGTAASNLAGTLAGANVQLVEPTAPVTLVSAVAGPTTVTIGPLTLDIHCPGCDLIDPLSSYRRTVTPGANRPAGLRVDGQTISLGSLAADVIELHSLNATTQTGGLTAQSLTGTAGYTGVTTSPAATLAATLPVYTPATTTTLPTGSAVTLTNAGNNILAVNGFQVAGDAASRTGFSLTDAPAAQTASTGASVAASGLTLNGVVSAGAAVTQFDPAIQAATGGNIAITTTGGIGALTLDGMVGANALSLNVSGAITQPSGFVVANTLGGVASTATFGAANQVTNLANFTTTGTFSLNDTRSLSVVGSVLAGSPNAEAPVLSLSATGGIDINGGSLTAGTVMLQATGSVTESNGPIVAGLLSGSASQLTASDGGNMIQTLMFAAPNGVTFANAGNLMTENVTASNGAINLATTGNFLIQAAIMAGTSASLTANSDITLANLSMVAAGGALTVTAGGNATLAGTQSAGGLLQVTAAGNLNSSGALTSTGGTIDIAATAGTLTQAGTLAAEGALIAIAGQSATLIGSTTAGSKVMLLSGSDVILAHGSSTSAGSSINATASAGSATLAGAEQAPLITVTAPTINLQGGLFTVSGVVQPGGALASVLPKATSGLGLYLEPGITFRQTGPTLVIPLGAANATVRIDLTGATGTIGFSAFNAPASTLILDLGAGSGTGSNIQVNTLDVLYHPSGNGSLNLNAVTVSNLTGPAAAGAGLAFPEVNRNYQANACAIASVNCIILRPQTVPVGNPIKELSLSFFSNQDESNDLIVPNISDQGL